MSVNVFAKRNVCSLERIGEAGEKEGEVCWSETRGLQVTPRLTTPAPLMHGVEL